MKADTDLMLDIGRAGTELERRLSEAVHAQDGIVIVRDPVTEKYFSYVLPECPVGSILRRRDIDRIWLIR